MKKSEALMIIYLIAAVVIFAGCVGMGFVLNSMETAMVTSGEANRVDTIISQIPESNIEETAAIIETIQPVGHVSPQNNNIEIAYAELIQALQANIFREFANFSTNSFGADMTEYNGMPAVMAEYAAKADADNTPAQDITGHIAITFDDGPHPTLTPLLLDALYERGIKATFFLLGMEVDRHPEIVARMYQEGHSIGNHSYRHPRFIDISRQSMINEIESTNRSIKAATGGSTPTLLRPPYGARNNMVLDVAREMDMSVVLWSVDPRDWNHRNAPIVRDIIVSYATDGSVVLLHDIHETSVEAAVMAIDKLLERGYVFVTVEELFALNELTLQAGKEYRSVYHSIGVSQ